MQSDGRNTDHLNQCQCPAAGFCARRQRYVTNINHRRCQSGQAELVDRLMTFMPKLPADNMQPPKMKRKTGYGDKLAAIIQRETGEQTTCTGCNNEIGSLNWMTRDQVLADMDNLCERIRVRASLKARAWWQRLGCMIAPEFVESQIRAWVMEAIQ